MTTLRNNLDGGPAGTTITAANSGQVPGNDPFDGTLKTGANTVFAFDTAFARPTAEYTMLVSTGAASGHGLGYWTTSMGAQSQIWIRLYCYFDVLPNNFTSPIVFLAETASGTGCQIGINSVGSRELFLESGGGVNVKTTAGITAGNWFRVEARMQFSATTGNADLEWYQEADSDTPTETISFSGQNFKASTAINYYIGYVNTDTNMEALYLSGIELNNTGWPGPAPFITKGVPGIQPNPIAIHQALT